MKPTLPRFNLADADRASEAWGCNCGPGALAAIMGMTLDEVRPHMGDFERKGYTNPTLMFDCLHRLYVAGLCKGWRDESKPKPLWPQHGLARVQWDGPWTAAGVPMRARYRFTHWVASMHLEGNIGVFDINCINNGSGWVTIEDWRDIVVPHILKECVPKANGRWHITHSIEVVRA